MALETALMAVGCPTIDLVSVFSSLSSFAFSEETRAVTGTPVQRATTSAMASGVTTPPDFPSAFFSASLASSSASSFCR